MERWLPRRSQSEGNDGSRLTYHTPGPPGGFSMPVLELAPPLALLTHRGYTMGIGMDPEHFTTAPPP